MEFIFYCLVFVAIIIILITWIGITLSKTASKNGAFFALFFSLEAWKRVEIFFSFGFVFGLLYGVFFGDWGASDLSFPKVVFLSTLNGMLIALIAVTLVNAVYIVFRLDREPDERGNYKEADRVRDLKKIEEKRAKTSSIYANHPAVAKPWHTGF